MRDEADASTNLELSAVGAAPGVQKLVDAVVSGTKAPANGPRFKRTKGYGRRVRRAAAQHDNPAVISRPYSRLGGAKLTKSDNQRAMEFRTESRRELSRIKLVRLLTECGELKFVVGVPGIRTVWQLSQASDATIATITGLGPARRKKIHAYLTGRGVKVVWAP